MPRAELIVVADRGVKFINDRLQVWFNLIPDPEDDGRNWYAGSTTSALLDNREILDPTNADLLWRYMCHDREKRCMQIDQIQLYHHFGGAKLGEVAQPFREPYRLITHSVQPGSVEVTVASFPFERPYPVGGEMRQLNCRLWRVIGLEDDASYLNEKLSIHVESDDEVQPCFAVRYYAYINTGWEDLKVLRSEDAQAFVAGRDLGARAAYAFGCSTKIEYLESRSHSVWALVSPCESLECRHLFSREADLGTVLDRASCRSSGQRVAFAGCGPVSEDR